MNQILMKNLAILDEEDRFVEPYAESGQSEWWELESETIKMKELSKKSLTYT